MSKKSKRKNKEKSATEIVDEEISVRENVLSYTDYNTIMSIQLLIDRLNEVIRNQVEVRSMLSSLREEVDSISAYLMVPGDMKDGHEGSPAEGKEDGEKTEGDTGEDNPPGADE